MTVVVKNDNLQIERIELGAFGTNAYVVICRQTGDSAVIDAPADAATIIEKLEGSNPRYILLTHNHMDHTGALAELQSELKVPIATHAADAQRLPVPPQMSLNDGDTVPLGKIELAVLHTPGHTPGSLSFRTGRYLLSGDTIFPGGPGKTWSPSDFRQIIESITERIFALPDDTEIYPGHGDATVLKREKEEFAIFSSRPYSPNLHGDVLWLST